MFILLERTPLMFSSERRCFLKTCFLAYLLMVALQSVLRPKEKQVRYVYLTRQSYVDEYADT